MSTAADGSQGSTRPSGVIRRGAWQRPAQPPAKSTLVPTLATAGFSRASERVAVVHCPSWRAGLPSIGALARLVAILRLPTNAVTPSATIHRPAIVPSHERLPFAVTNIARAEFATPRSPAS